MTFSSRRRPRIMIPAFLLLAAALMACGADAEPDGETPALDSPATGSVPDSTATGTPGGTENPAEQGSDAGAGDQTPPDTSEGWREAPVVGAGGGGHALLTEVRTARHQGYDRIVFEFDSTVPEYAVRYVEEPFACGSGNPVEVGAPAALEVRFRSAAAHDEEGQVTVRDRNREPGHPTLRTARISCDFEGEVTWVLGVDRPGPVRVIELGSPARLVLDLRHR